jgi:amidase
MADWEQIGAKKRQALWDLIPSEWVIPAQILPAPEHDDVSKFGSRGWFTPEELEITESSVASLLPKLASGSLKSETVTRAFCKRAAAAHQLVRMNIVPRLRALSAQHWDLQTNCLSEICFYRAIEDAKAIDQHLEKTGHIVGPLHGLPITIKDNFDIAGLDTTIGFASHVGNPATKDSDIVAILRRAGAVIYVKTNVPTAMMLAETVNNTFGRTLNPLNRKLTSGGSSGGESALIAFRGSPIGIGTDIGGSLRIPAACTGMSSVQYAAQGRFMTISCRSLQSQAEFWEVSHFGHPLRSARTGSGAERRRPNGKLIDGS